MANKSSYSSFQTDWQKTVTWAQSKGISPNAYMPIYQLDSARMLSGGSGYAMSQGARANAILAAAGMGKTQLPTDNPSPTDILGNVRHNAASLFSGFNPVHFVPNLFDTATNAIAHPSSEIFKPLEDLLTINQPFFGDKQAAMKDFTNTILGPHAIWAFVPGAYDAAEAYRGKAGFNELATNPLTAIADVIPLTRLPMKFLAHTDLGEGVAQAAGVSKEELGKMGPMTTSWKVLKNRPTNQQMIAKVGGQTVYKPTTNGEKLTSFRNHLGIGKDQAEVEKLVKIHEELGTEEIKGYLSNLDLAWSKMNKDEQTGVNTFLSTVYHIDEAKGGFRPDSEIIADPKFSVAQKTAIQTAIDFSGWYTNLLLNRGILKYVRTPQGQELYLATDKRAAAVVSVSDQFDAANREVEDASKEFYKLIDTSQIMDSIMGKFIPQMQRLVHNIEDAIRGSLPDMAQGPQADRLRNVLPTGQKFASLTDKGKKANLNAFLGLDRKEVETITRPRWSGGDTAEAEPFSGRQETWSEDELTAWTNARKALKRREDVVTDKMVERLANDNLRLVNKLHTTVQHATVSATVADMMAELIKPGGIADQLAEAFDQQNHQLTRDLARVLYKKLHVKSFMSPNASEQLKQLVQMSESIKQYAEHRDKMSIQLQKIWNGEKRFGEGASATAKKASLAEKIRKADQLAENFKKVAIENPPVVWDNFKASEYARLLGEKEEGRAIFRKALDTLRVKNKMSAKNLDALEQNPQTLVEMIDIDAVASFENDMLQNVEYGTAKEVSNSANNLIADLRSKGMPPLYMPTLSVFDRMVRGGKGMELYNMTMGRHRIGRETVTKEKAKDRTPATIYNYQAAMHKVVHEYVLHAHELDFQEKDMPQFLHDRADLINIIKTYHADELIQQTTGLLGEARVAAVKAFYEAKLSQWGLVSYDPTAIFSISHPRFANREMYIDKNFSKALESQWKEDNPLMKGYDAALKVFRTSILGYSPRFTAHVVIGGGLMAVARADASWFHNARMGWQMARTHQIPDEVMAKYFPGEDAKTLYIKAIGHASTQEGGAGEVAIQHAMGYSAGQFSIMESIARAFGKEYANKDHPDFFKNMVQFLPKKNYTLTRFSTGLYKSMMFLQGVDHAAKTGHFFEDVWDENAGGKDAMGRPVGKIVRKQRDMTPDQLIHEGMRLVDRVMGDVRAMAPLERNVLTRIFPFWSWTRHVLQYVMTFPVDHPYRTMFLTQLSRMGEDEQNPLLPARTQLLFFLGQPDAAGNVNAIDTRFADPLRDTASLATLGGWISALNPVLQMPATYIDPQMTYGSNVLYPNITYDSIYGTNTAPPQGNLLTSLEQIVPEVQGGQEIYDALTQSGQYAYLAKSGNKNALMTKIMSSLGVPFLHEQSLNLRQMMGTQEIDRYNQAKAAFKNAWTSGNFDQLQGYAEGPDPREQNGLLNITPAGLKAVYDQQQAAYPGFNPAAVTPDLPTVSL